MSIASQREMHEEERIRQQQSEKLPGEPNTLYNRKTMLREVLQLRLTEWLEQGRFDNVEVRKFRDIVSELNDDPPEGFAETLPKDIDYLHCIPFANISPAVRKGALLACLEYACIDQTSGELLGEEGWKALLAQIDRLCAVSTETEVAAFGLEHVRPPDQWVVSSILSQIKRVFGDDWFDICTIDRVSATLKELGRSFQENSPGAIAAKQAHAGLRALHCVRYDEMPLDVLDGLKAAVLVALALNERTVQILLGAGAWTEIAAMSFPQTVRQAAEQAEAAKKEAAPFWLRLARMLRL